VGSDRIRWGFIGTGRIAGAFAEGLRAVPDAELVAAWSTSRGAPQFAENYEVPRLHKTREDLLCDRDVDVVYVASPHSSHMEHGIAALNAGKPVLCEKPFAINAEQAERVIRTAREKRVFVMEAMWTRFFPLMVKLRQMIAEGIIGEVRMVASDFGFRAAFDPKNRAFNPELGGGALLDVGVYCVSLASMLFGPPERIAGLAHLGASGVDEQSAMVLAHGKGELAMCYTAVSTETPQEASIMGTSGQIRIHSPWWKPTKMSVMAGGRPVEDIEFAVEGNGYNYEAAEVMRCLREGKLESPTMSLDESLSIMRTMDQLRAEWGLKYPME
jgi:predicted dehydrogenase